jgi:hypothetical protein
MGRGLITIRVAELERAEWGKAAGKRGLGVAEWMRVVLNEEAGLRGISGLKPRAQGRKKAAEIEMAPAVEERRGAKRGKSVVDRIANVANETLRKAKKGPHCKHGVEIGWRCSFGCGIVKPGDCVVE